MTMRRHGLLANRRGWREYRILLGAVAILMTLSFLPLSAASASSGASASSDAAASSGAAASSDVAASVSSAVSAASSSSAASSTTAASASTQRLIHVGFFKFDGYHDMDSSGQKSGYGYDFLQMIAGYANFEYVYVGYQKSWDDMLDMLDDGQIDMLTYGVKLPEYEERFDFSKHSIGTSSTLLTTSVTNATFAANDYAPFDGMRVGMLEGTNRKSAFDEYAVQKGFSYSVVYYPDMASLQAALQAGTDIDAMVADEMRVLSNEVIIDKFDTHDLYVMVKKGNTELLNTIDEAIRKLDAADPGWTVELMSKYFLSQNSAGLPMTLSETQYIQDLVSRGTTLKVLFNPARYPLSYYEDGEARGALVDIFKQIASEYGLPYEFIQTNDVDEYYDLRSKGQADIVLDFAESADEAEILGYRLTSSYASSDYSIITLKDFSGTAQRIAVIEGSDTFRDIAKSYNSRAKITYYDDFASCLKAVTDGTVDCTFTYSITGQIFAIEDNANQIKVTQLDDHAFEFRFAVNSDVDMTLYGLLNKATHNLDSSSTEETFNSYVLSAKRDFTLWGYFVNNPLMLVAIVAAMLIVLIGFILAQRRNAAKLKTSNDALNASRDALEDALEAANDANAAKTRFLSQMSHDIRTPLNGIIGMTRIASDNVDDPASVSNALQKIGYSSDHLLTLINDILDLSRIESGKMTLTYEPTDIRMTIQQCIEVLKGSVINRSIDVVCDVSPIDHPFVLTDALHVRQILINIISNAVKFTPDGGQVTFRTTSHTDEDGRNLICRFEISDTGIGMSEEFQQHIFEAFTQEEEHNARTQYKGSGLGMSIVKQFTDMLGGTIAIASKVDEGTLVTVELPFEIDQDAMTRQDADADKDEAAAFDFEGIHILLVEDNDINLEIAQLMLESKGMVVDTAGDGKIAVQKFAASGVGEYRCVLMDIMMPEMDGYEATRAIRALDRADAKTVPIIAMTANAFTEDVKTALDSGMDGHIAKPIDKDVVLKTIARFVTL